MFIELRIHRALKVFETDTLKDIIKGHIKLDLKSEAREVKKFIQEKTDAVRSICKIELHNRLVLKNRYRPGSFCYKLKPRALVVEKHLH